MNEFGYPLRGIGGWLIIGAAVPLWSLLTLLRYLAAEQPFAAFMAVLFLLPALYGLIGLLLRYGLVVLLDTARGYAGPPQVDVPELNPFLIPHMFVLIALAAASAGFVLQVDDSGARIVILASLTLVASPLITLVGLNDGFDGVNVRSLGRLIARLGPEAPGVGLVGAAWAGLAAATLATSPRFFAVLGTLYLLVLAHRLVGRLLYRHRSALQLDTAVSPEQDAAAESQAVRQAFLDLLVELHRLCGTDQVERAYAQLQSYLERPESLDDASVYTSLQDFHDPRLRLEYAFRYIERLVERREPKRAWQVLADAVTEDADFRPSSDERLISLVAHAAPEQAAAVDVLLSDFEDRFPDSHLVANALFRRACACIDFLERRSEGQDLLRRIESEHPNFARQERFIAYRDTHA